jgi:hypothetical protein
MENAQASVIIIGIVDFLIVVILNGFIIADMVGDG